MQQKTENEDLIKELPEFLSNLYKKNLTIVKCPSCESDLQSGKIYHYRHLKENGWVVPGFENKQWLFLVCPKCRFQISLWKLGVDKEFQIDLEKDTKMIKSRFSKANNKEIWTLLNNTKPDC